MLGTILKVASAAVSLLAPGKSKEAIQGAINTVITTDKEVMAELAKTRQFYLDFFRPDLLPQWAVAIKNLWRPFVAVIFSLFNLIFYAITAIQGNPQMPDKYFLTVSTGIIFTCVLGRSVEKWRKKIV